ncbi:unnamed protein product, partial [Dovyalis caffra]
ASHGIRDRTSKGKARFQSLLGKRAPTGSDTPISWMKDTELEENASISVHLHQRPRAKRSSIEKKKTSAID